MQAQRRGTAEPAEVRVLAHPLRLELLTHLMSTGPATASQCARALGDTPSNCSYHLRVLAIHGLVAQDASTDARQRPWRASIDGQATEPDTSGCATYRLRLTHVELTELSGRLDALIRPYLDTNRTDPPADATTVHFGLHAVRSAGRSATGGTPP